MQINLYVLVTDHKALISIFGAKMVAASRLQRWAVILSAYNFEIQYITSEKNQIADCLSRCPIESKLSQTDNYDFSYFNLIQKTVSLINDKMIRKMSKKDVILSKIYNYTLNGWPGNVEDALKPYFHRRNEIYLENQILM